MKTAVSCCFQVAKQLELTQLFINLRDKVGIILSQRHERMKQTRRMCDSGRDES